MKPNNKLSYVHQQSNHPPALLKNIPRNIRKRLTSISSSKEVFDESIAPYQKALTESGYDHKLTYNPLQEKALKNKRKWTRNITWYNPPFNSNVRTNLGRTFLHITGKSFPKNHPLRKISNRHMLKLSLYPCMPNMKSVILSHNNYVVSNFNTTTWHLQLQKETRLSTRRKMPPIKCNLPSHCNHSDDNWILCRTGNKL